MLHLNCEENGKKIIRVDMYKPCIGKKIKEYIVYTSQIEKQGGVLTGKNRRVLA